jgi:hypothetical protein
VNDEFFRGKPIQPVPQKTLKRTPRFKQLEHNRPMWEPIRSDMSDLVEQLGLTYDRKKGEITKSTLVEA